ncbi:MAG: lytic transglycosylase domain-containing protein [Oligoflexia bacterium]|nr:lytic transglycosylase domain-containing protein [Oligoflexia bacterium]
MLPLPVSQEHLPDGYLASVWYDPVSADKTFSRVSEDLADVLPEFPAAYDLARAGLTVDAGRILRDAFDAWDAAAGLSDPLSLRLRTIQVSNWREITIFARQPNLSYRLCIGLVRKAATQDDALAAARLAYPVVHLPELWRHGQAYDVDPFLVMAIMRQESRYQDTVLSHAGAIGLLQVMPRTGAKVAALLGQGQYSPAALEIPATNLRYGTYYLSLLLQRFGGSFPLAVASYNGGPHNISRWLRPWLARPEGIGMDALVEQIEYDESRDYVKKVSSNYDAYTRLYGPPGARVVIPPRPSQDDPTIVDF